MPKWEKMTVGDLCDTISDTYRGDDKDVVLINTSDVLEGKVLNHQVVENKNLKGQFKKTFKENDILYSEIRPANKRYAFVDFGDTDNYIASTKLMVLRPRKDVVRPRFLFSFLASKSVLEELQQLAETRSGTFPQITFSSELAPTPINVPDLETQDRIVGILDVIEGKISTNAEINKNLEQQIETILLKTIDNANTQPVKLGDYLYIKGRIGWKGLKKSEYLPVSDYRIINGESLTLSGIDWNKAGYISAERYEESPEIMLKIGDILLSKDGTIGKIGYVDKLETPTSVASGIFVIRNTRQAEISTQFIYYLLKSRLFKAFITSRAEGSVIPHLYQKDFTEFEFQLPSPDDMKTFDDTTAAMFSMVFSNLNENERLIHLRDSLLPKLMSGELDISDIDL